MTRTTIFLVTASILTTACGPNDAITVRFDPTVDFDQVCTFAVADLDDLAPDDDSLPPIPPDVRVNLVAANNAAADRLSKIGLTEVQNAENADVVIFSAGAVEEQTAIEWVCIPDWTWWGWGYVWDPCAWLEPIEYQYTEGTLVVGLADPVSEKVVFGGLAQGYGSSADPIKRIENDVKKIFKEYPSKAKNCD